MITEQSYVGRGNFARHTEGTVCLNAKNSQPPLNHGSPFPGEEPEAWKPIPGFEHTHTVSSFGAIRSLPRQCGQRFEEGTLLKPAITKAGYERVNLIVDQKPKSVFNHRAVAMAFLPNPQDLPYVNHIDGNGRNNHVSNLEWVTPEGNVRHANSYGGPGVGRKRSQQLTDEVVSDWFACSVELRPSQQELADKYKTSIATIGRILKKYRDHTPTPKGKYQWKLSEEQGAAVGNDFINRPKGVTVKMIAAKYGISPSLVNVYGRRAMLSTSKSRSDEHTK